MRKKSFVLSDCHIKASEYLYYDRLYAFNRKHTHTPEFSKNTRVILDSGAYHLDKAKKSMDADYISALFDFYRKYGANEHVYCIAPDVVGNAKKSMSQYEQYATTEKTIKIAPVLQLPMRHVDLMSLVKQCEFYAKFKPEIIAFANNFGAASEAVKPSLASAHKIIRHYFGSTWIHVLGAGYNCKDAVEWLSIGFDSCDSLSYFLSAQAKEAWIPNSYHSEIVDGEVTDVALHNAKTVDDCIYSLTEKIK